MSDYAELALHLYADYCPGRLMDFLQGSQTYPLEAALEVAQQRGLIDEQVGVSVCVCVPPWLGGEQVHSVFWGAGRGGRQGH